MPDGHPFTVFEATIRLYTVDAAGQPLDEQWLGACVDKLLLEGDYRERPIQYHGRRVALNYHEDESWSITATNPRLIDLRQDPPRPVALRRNQTYALVVVWWDREQALWLKRCYFGVKAQPAVISEENINQTLRFTAEEMTELAGTNTPDFGLIRTGEVFYVEGAERTLLYAYEPATRTFTAAAPDRIPDAAEIISGVTGELRIEIGGVLALLADADGVEVGELVCIGGSFLDDEPRLEFWVGNTRCASLSVETLVSPDALEAVSPPAAERKIEVFNPGWLFTFTSARVVAPNFTERV